MDIYKKLPKELQYIVNEYLQEKKQFNKVIDELIELNFYHNFYGPIIGSTKLQLYKYYTTSGVRFRIG